MSDADVGIFPTTLDGVIKRLSAHFSEIELKPPLDQPTAASVLSACSLPCESLPDLYVRSDGLGVPSVPEERALLSLREATQVIVYVKFAAHGLLPIRTDGSWNYDCLVLGNGVAAGAVVFWDHEQSDRPQMLLAGTLSSYLDMWSDYLITTYDRDGRMWPAFIPPRQNKWPFVGEPARRHFWPHDRDWVRALDPVADRLLNDPIVRGWLVDPT